MLLHRFGDLVLATDRVLPELPRAARGPAAISLRPLPDPSGAYRLDFGGRAEFEVAADGSAIDCRPEPGVAEHTLRHLLLDQVLPRALSLHGRLVLHGAAIATPRGAALLVGDSGVGKSTLGTALAEAGRAMLADDCVLVRPAGPARYELLASYPGLRLLPDSARQLFRDAPPRTVAMAQDSPKRRVVRRGSPIPFTPGPEPLGAIFRLDPRAPDGGPIELSALSGREAVLTLVRACFQLHPADALRSRALFDTTADLASAVPVRCLSFARDLGALDRLRDAVLRELERSLPPRRTQRGSRTAG